MSGHADDLDPLRFELTDADQDALADGGLVGEGFGGEHLIHYAELAIRELSASVKPRPAISGVVHGFEIAGDDGDVVDGLELAGSVRAGARPQRMGEKRPASGNGVAAVTLCTPGQCLELDSRGREPMRHAAGVECRGARQW